MTAPADYPIFVAFHYELSGQRHFEQRAAALRSRCQLLGIELDASDQTDNVAAFIADFKERNEHYDAPKHIGNRYIPTFLEERLREHERPILYLHCDSEILHRPPAEAFAGMDVGYTRGASRTKQQRILGSPIYFRPSRTGLDFLAIWGHMCRRIDTNRAEHGMLMSTVAAFNGHPRVREFPVRMGSRDRMDDPHIFC